MRPAAAALLAACLLLLAPAAVLGQRRRKLDDLNFEHFTQAATGQTTGVWFVNFCSASAKTCKDLAPAWDELGKELLQEQLFLTTVDAHSSPQLGQRFGIATLPTLILFRDRKMYKFDGKLAPGGDYKEQLRSFAREGYASTQALEVPPQPSPFDWLVRGAQAKLAALQTALAAGDVPQLAALLLPLLLVCLFALALMLASVAFKKTKKD